MSDDFRWYNVDLTKEKAEAFKVWLRDRKIYFEPSSAWNLIHFECLMTPAQSELAGVFLKELEGIRLP